MTSDAALVLRLAGPLQSWGTTSRHNRRDTAGEPTKSGVVGLLAAAEGRRRTQPIDDLARLDLGVRIDQPGQLRRDYHTASRPDGSPLPSSVVSSRGTQKPTGPAKYTYVTERFYLEDAAFVVAVRGPEPLLTALVQAVRHPAFPLALGRRSCVPSQPLLLLDGESELWPADLLATLSRVRWQVSTRARDTAGRRQALTDTVALRWCWMTQPGTRCARTYRCPSIRRAAGTPPGRCRSTGSPLRPVCRTASRPWPATTRSRCWAGERCPTWPGFG